ncbi:MAG TPA: isoprenylcysteine carboxylmethyltransferase family protein [Bellilinea sp.]|nr:isoprenylcysteine carboxylmethyltransferase family protein [Bellilinea sp.]
MDNEFLGKPALNPWLFYSGKISGYIAIAYYGLDILRRPNPADHVEPFMRVLSYLFLAAGLILVLLSLPALGKSLRFGLPTTETALKTEGLYRYSRNPIYLGINLISLAAILGTLNLWVTLLSLFSAVTYHLIIMAEEKFLLERFGEPYREYMSRVGRYL